MIDINKNCIELRNTVSVFQAEKRIMFIQIMSTTKYNNPTHMLIEKL